jgi:hypothetical protein
MNWNVRLRVVTPQSISYSACSRLKFFGPRNSRENRRSAGALVRKGQAAWRGAAFARRQTARMIANNSWYYLSSDSRRLPKASPRRISGRGWIGRINDTLQEVATSGDVRGSRLQIRLTLANAKFDQYGFSSSHRPKRLPSRRWASSPGSGQFRHDLNGLGVRRK